VAWDSLAVPEEAEAFSAAKQLLYYMIARTTGGPDVDGLAYTRARFKVLADPVWPPSSRRTAYGCAETRTPRGLT
jgi:hypothetical protein